MEEEASQSESESYHCVAYDRFDREFVLFILELVVE